MLPLSLKKKLSQRGFTLVELLIVVVILGILATVVITQFSTSTDDAKLSSMKATLASVRSAINYYKVDHAGKNPPDMAHLTQYTDSEGNISTEKVGDFKFGPYLNANIPDNPVIDKPNVDEDSTSADITETTEITSTTGWIYYPKTGRFVANSVNAYPCTSGKKLCDY